MDGCYVAHQGKIAGKATAWMFKKYKNTGKFPAIINVMMKLMGTTLEERSEGLTNGLYRSGSNSRKMVPSSEKRLVGKATQTLFAFYKWLSRSAPRMKWKTSMRDDTIFSRKTNWNMKKIYSMGDWHENHSIGRKPIKLQVEN